MNDDDITAFRAAPVAAQPPRRRGSWRWVFVALFALALLATLVLAALIASVGDLGGPGVNLTIDGETVRLGGWHGGHGVLALGGVLVAVLAVLCVVPVVVALALAIAALGIGIAMFVVLAVTGVALSPLLLPVALLWWAFKPRRTVAA